MAKRKRDQGGDKSYQPIAEVPTRVIQDMLPTFPGIQAHKGASDDEGPWDSFDSDQPTFDHNNQSREGDAFEVPKEASNQEDDTSAHVCPSVFTRNPIW